MPTYSIKVGSYTLQEVKKFSIRLSMRELADSFTAEIADRVVIEDGSPVEVSIEGRVVLVGEVQVDRLAKSVGARDASISGFSAARRLVKSSIMIGDGLASRTVKNQSLLQIVTAVCKPFGIVVDVSETTAEIAGQEIEKVRVGNGDKAFAFLQKLCKRQGCILVSGAASIDADGIAKPSVRIARIGVRRSPIPIEYPSPRCKMIDFERDVGDVHSEYIVTRRGGGIRDEDGGIEGLDGRAIDERVPYSPLLIQAEAGGNSQAALDRQAERELRRRAAEGDRVSATYEGWSPNNSQALFWPNTLYPVIDREEGYGELLVLASVELSDSIGGGATAKLELMPPDAYAILDELKIKKTPGRGRRPPPGFFEWVATGVTSAAKATNKAVTFDALKAVYKPEDPDA